METKHRQFKVIGSSVMRIDGRKKVIGVAKYMENIKLPGLLYGKILGSPYPHARIISIDTSKAEKLLGVAAVVTGKDIPQNRRVLGNLMNDQSVLNEDEVCYVGDPIAAVAATSEEIAEMALELIDIKYEVLPFILDPVKAMERGAIKVHINSESNIAAVRRLRIGDVEVGLKASDLVLEGTFHSTLADQVPVDKEAAIAVFEPGGTLTVWSNLQAPEWHLATCSRCFGIPKNKIKLIAPTLAGTYGSRDNARLVCTTVSLAKKAGVGKPVKISVTREEEFASSDVQRDYTHHFTVGVNRDGKILALKDEAIYDAGAYADLALMEAEYCRASFANTYNVPNIASEAKIVYTNEPFSGALRGFGDTQYFWGLEQVISKAADGLNMGQVEFRLKNVYRSGEYAPLLRKEIGTFSLSTCLEKVSHGIGYNERPLSWKVDDNRIRAIGVACGNHLSGEKVGFNSMIWRTGTRTPEELYEVNPNHPALMRLPGGKISWRYGFEVIDKKQGRDLYDADPSSCVMVMHDDGTLSLYFPEIDFGNGSDTTMAIFAAEELGLKPEDITIYTGDTSLPVHGLGTYASRTTVIGGKAVCRAAAEIRNQLFQHATKIFLELGRVVNAEGLEVKDGKIYIRGTDTFLWIADVAYRAYASAGGGYLIAKGYYDPPAMSQNAETGENPMCVTFTPMAGGAEVEVDLRTGEYRICKIALAYDTGTVINRLGAEGQAQGSIVQGINYGCFNNLMIDKRGTVLNPNLLKDVVVSSSLIPEINIDFVEDEDLEGPYGAKGFGEGGMVPVPAAIACALRNAIQHEIEEQPYTPEEIFRTIAKRWGKIGQEGF